MFGFVAFAELGVECLGQSMGDRKLKNEKYKKVNSAG